MPVPPRRTRRADFPQRAPQVALVRWPSYRRVECRQRIRQFEPGLTLEIGPVEAVPLTPSSQGADPLPLDLAPGSVELRYTEGQSPLILLTNQKESTNTPGQRHGPSAYPECGGEGNGPQEATRADSRGTGPLANCPTRVTETCVGLCLLSRSAHKQLDCLNVHFRRQRAQESTFRLCRTLGCLAMTGRSGVQLRGGLSSSASGPFQTYHEQPFPYAFYDRVADH